MDRDRDGNSTSCGNDSGCEAWSTTGSLWDRACGLLK